MNGFLIIPSSNNSGNDSIVVLTDEYSEAPKCIIVTLNNSSLFSSESPPRFIFVWDCITGISDVPVGKKFTIFPNPVNDRVEIAFDEDYQGSVQVFDQWGRLVLSRQVHDRVLIIDAAGLDAGIYFIKIQKENKVHTEKIIKL
jgi:hypothetical protein